MRGRRWLRRVLILALTLSALGLAGRAGITRVVRAWGASSPVIDSAWVDRPWCLSPSRPYLCLLEYRLRGVGGPAVYGLADFFGDVELPSELSEIPPSG